MEHDKTSIYVEHLNQKVLPTIDYDRLQTSYGTQDKDYAKSSMPGMSEPEELER
jgi:hypothetical protein